MLRLLSIREGLSEAQPYGSDRVTLSVVIALLCKKLRFCTNDLMLWHLWNLCGIGDAGVGYRTSVVGVTEECVNLSIRMGGHLIDVSDSDGLLDYRRKHSVIKDTRILIGTGSDDPDLLHSNTTSQSYSLILWEVGMFSNLRKRQLM